MKRRVTFMLSILFACMLTGCSVNKPAREKGDYYLSDRELQNIRFMTENYSKCVVLLNTGGVIDLTELRKISGVQAILLTGQTGNMGGHAVADVLMAKTVPSGKLTDTWARSYDDYPS